MINNEPTRITKSSREPVSSDLEDGVAAVEIVSSGWDGGDSEYVDVG
jgi:hypothetical protein